MDQNTWVDWLLQAQTASIRYQTVRGLLDLAETDPQVLAARRAMTESGPIPFILAEQAAHGGWTGEHDLYTPKYTSAHWSMILLTELQGFGLADASDERLKLGAKSALAGGKKWMEAFLDGRKIGLVCLWANMLRYSVYSGLQDDPTLQMVLQAVLRNALQAEWRCPYNGDQPCAWGAGRALWAFGGLPASMRTPEVEQAIQSTIHFLLEQHNLVRADYPVYEGGKIHPIWSRLNFPLFYQADILLILRSLAELRLINHPGATAGLDWLLQRRVKDGRWTGASPFLRRTWAALGDREETHRWVTLQAAQILKAAGGLTIPR